MELKKPLERLLSRGYSVAVLSNLFSQGFQATYNFDPVMIYRRLQERREDRR